MEMEMEIEAQTESTVESVTDLLLARLNAAAGQLEQVAERLAGREIQVEASRATARELELESLLAQAESTIASLRAGRKTLPTGVANLLAKDGSAVEAGTLDAALTSLSLEQRIAVKAQLMRSGLIG